MKGLESPVKKRARLSLKKRESEPPSSSSSSSPRNSCISSSNALSPSSSSSLSLLSHSPASSNVSHSASNATNSLAAFSNVNTATLPPPLPPSVTPSATITTCASSASGLLTTTTTTTTTTTSVSVTSTSEENSTAAAAARKIDSSSSSSSSSHASSSSLPRLKEADNFLESETNHDVISINSDDVYESMPIVAALENLDNTCFLNSVLQILRYTPKFVHGLDELCYKVSNAKKGKQLENSRSVNEDVNMSCQVWEMTLAISEMFKQMNALEKKMQAMSNVSSTHIALKPDKLQHVVRKLNSMFEGSAQHDAQEFLQFILYHLQEAEKQMKKCQQEARSENTNGGGGGRRRMAANASPGSAGTNLDNGNNNNNNNNNNNCLNTTSGPSSLNVVNPVSSTYTTNLITSTTILSTTTTTSTSSSSASLSASSSSLTSSNNALSATNEPVSLPNISDKSSISEVNSMNPETRCTSFLKTSGPNSLQNPSSDISTSLPQTRHNSSPGKESINIVNSNSTTTAVTTMTPTPWLSPLSAELSASSAETPNATRDSYATHNGNHEGKPNGIVSALTSETEHCYLKQKVANGEMDSCALSPTANAPLSKHTFSSSATSPISSKTVSGGPPRHCLPYDTSLFLTNGMSKNQVNQIKNSVVRLENCDQVCNSLQQSVNAYYAIECLSAGRTLNGKRKDFVEQLFLGTILSRTRCLECEKASEKHEEFLEVSVPLKKAATSHPKNSDGEGSDLENEDHSDRNTLISFISSFSEVEKLQGDNKYYCDSCCNYVEADRSLHYETLPDILTVHLKRFSASSELGLMCKINDHVDVPLSLPCLLYKCHKNCCRQDHRYTLFGIITHAGYTISSGHYVAYVKTSASALTWHFPLNPNNNNNNSSAGGGGLSSSGEASSLASNVDAYPHPVGLDSPPQQDDDIFWLECDDSSVRVFTEEDFLERLSSEGLLTGTPYLLFYHKTPMGRSF